MRKLIITEEDDSSDDDEELEGEEEMAQGGMKKLVIEIEDDDEEEEEEVEKEEVNESTSNHHSNKSYVMVGSQTNRDPSRIPQLKKEAKTYFQAGNYQGALDKFVEAFDNVPPITTEEREAGDYTFVGDACALHNNIALCFIKMDNFQGVIAECTATLDLEAAAGPIEKKMVVKALLRRGAAHEALGDWQKALDDMCKVMELDATKAEAADAIGRLMKAIQEGKPKPSRAAGSGAGARVGVALPAVTAAVASTTLSNCVALKSQGNELFKAGDLKGARESYQKSIEVAVEDDAHQVDTQLAKCAVASACNLAMSCIKDSSFAEAVKACALAFGM